MLRIAIVGSMNRPTIAWLPQRKKLTESRWTGVERMPPIFGRLNAVALYPELRVGEPQLPDQSAKFKKTGDSPIPLRMRDSLRIKSVCLVEHRTPGPQHAQRKQNPARIPNTISRLSIAR